MHKVRTILERKKSPLITVNTTTVVLDVLKLMAEKNIGSVVVTDKMEQYCGIVTERDYSRKVVLKGKSSTETTVEEIMSTDHPKVSPNDSVEHCMALMTDNNIRYLPVFDNSNLVGIISMSDVVKETIFIQQEMIRHLKEYINL